MESLQSPEFFCLNDVILSGSRCLPQALVVVAFLFGSLDLFPTVGRAFEILRIPRPHGGVLSRSVEF